MTATRRGSYRPRPRLERASLVAGAGIAAALVSCSAVQSTWLRAGYDSGSSDAIKRIAVVGWAAPDYPKLGELLGKVAADRIGLKTNYMVYQSGAMSGEWREHCSVAGDAEPADAESSGDDGARAADPAGDAEPAATDAASDTESGGDGARAADPASDAEPAASDAESSGDDGARTADLPDAEPAATDAAASAESGGDAGSQRALEGVLAIHAREVTGTDEIQLFLVAELYSCGSGQLVWRAEGREGNAAADEDLAQLTDSYATTVGAEIAPYVAPAFLVLRDMLAVLPNPVLSDDEVMEKIMVGRAPRELPRMARVVAR